MAVGAQLPRRPVGARASCRSDTIENWRGNAAADAIAKTAARKAAALHDIARRLEEAQENALKIIKKLAISAAWVVKLLPEADGDRVKLKKTTFAAGGCTS